MRVATIDIGTNTILLLIAEQTDDGAIRPVEERAVITRLGQGVDATGQLHPHAVERTRACLEEYARIVDSCGVDRVGVVGTSAMRDARGGGEVIAEVRRLFGEDMRILSGTEEARLTFRGAVSGLGLDESREVAVFDIGGGSTEVVIGRATNPPSLGFVASFDIGSVRLTERHVHTDPPTPRERAAVADSARQAFAAVPALPSGTTPVGIAGTMTTLTAVSLAMADYRADRVHGHVIPRRELERVVELLAAAPLEARRRITGMEPKRADVIVAGGAIALALLDHWRATAVHVSDRGVRWGLALELALEVG
ncbi:MAG: Ppx/GppA phosphatase family protein [Polyangiaceae bacterium]